MSELFTQNYSDKPLFHTDTDISESLHNQVDEASNGEELLDSTEKQTESLLSNDDYVTKNAGTTATEYGNGVATTRKAAAAPNGSKTAYTM